MSLRDWTNREIGPCLSLSVNWMLAVFVYRLNSDEEWVQHQGGVEDWAAALFIHLMCVSHGAEANLTAACHIKTSPSSRLAA